MAEGPAPLDATQQPRWAPPMSDEEVLEAESSGAAPAHVQELEELEASRRYKHKILDDAASSTSFRKGGPLLRRAAQIRVLETELSRAAAQRDLLRKVALSAEARQHSEEDKAKELEKRSKAADNALAVFEEWMDSQRLSRSAQAPEKQKELAALTTQAKVAREAASAQRGAAERERHVCLHAKREADRVERDHHANAEVLEALAGEKAEQAAFQESEVAKRVSIEEGVAQKMSKHHKARAGARADARKELLDKAQAQRKAAKAARAAAAERSNLLVRDAAPALQEVVRMKDEAHAQRVECVLQLKADTEAAAALIRGENERRTAERLREEAEHEAEKDKLAAKGLNPYKVFKQRAVDARATREEQRQEKRIRSRKEELAERLKKEEVRRLKQDAKARYDKEQEQRMRDELGRHVVDARNREFLRSRTIDGTDILDPSGRSFRVEPSQVTTIKDAAFGLGYHPRKRPAMAAAVVDLVAAKPRHAGVGTGEFARLVPRGPTEAGGGSPSAGDNAGSAENSGASRSHQQQQQLLQDLAPPAGKSGVPGAGVPFVEDGEEAGVEHGGGGRGSHADNGKGGEGGGGGVRGEGRALSVFEAKALQKARARQRDRMEAGEPQVAAGRTFKDRPSFVARPDRLVFKDFVVGKVHRRRVVLTNVSLTFNTLKVLAMSDEISRFFEVTYAKPGRLSAGMTCAVDIAFTPKVDEDILTELPIRTQTGPLSIPVECTARRVKPRLSTTLVVFRGTVMGERETARVAVTNEGVIPTRFTVTTKSTTTTTTTPPAPPAPSRSHEAPASGSEPLLRGCTVGDGVPSEKGETSDPRPVEGTSSGEAELMEKAAAVGDAGTKYPPGKRAIEVLAGSGELAGYGSAEIVVVFSPLAVGDFRTVKTIRFEGSQEEFQLVVEASSAPVAVFPAEARTDLRCCVFGKLYLKKIRLCNRGKIAMKAVARVPPSLRGCASFSPDMGFVQPGSFFEFGLRFRPDPESLARCMQDGWGVLSPPPAPPPSSPSPLVPQSPLSVEGGVITTGHAEKLEATDVEGGGGGGGEPVLATAAAAGRLPDSAAALGGTGGGLIVIPLRFEVPGQALPARSVLQARLTGWSVDVQCEDAAGNREAAGRGDGGEGERECGRGVGAVVNFGRCFVGQSVSRRVSLRNTSMLPARFGFVGTPPEVDVQPADGFGVILPGEERWVEAKFSPSSSVSHDSTMSFRTSLGQTTVVRCRGCGVDPVVRLSHTVLSLAPACPGDAVTASVFVNNISAVEQSLEFVAPEPELSFLAVCPSVVLLPPGRGARVEVSFCPPPTSGRHQQGLPAAQGAAPATAGTTEDGESGDEKDGHPGAEAPGGGEKVAPSRGASKNKDAKKKGVDEKGGTAAAAAAKQTKKGKGKGAEAAEAEQQRQQQQQQQQRLQGAEQASDETPAEEGGANDSGASGDGGNASPPVPLYAGDMDESDPVDSRGDGGGGGGIDDEDEEEEPWSRHGRWRVPCFLKGPAVHGSAGGKAGGGGGQGGGSEAPLLPPLALEVATVTVERVLSVDQTRIDFGQLAIGTKAEAILRVRNNGEDDAPLEGGGLNSVGPFEVINAFRVVPARGGSHRCALQFRPERAGIISETLVLTSPSLGKSIRVRLRGEGIRPILTILPADGHLDMGHVLEGDTREREVKLYNDSVFPLRYTTSLYGPRPPANVNHLETFALVPCEGGVPPGESVTVKATFSPDYSRVWPFLGAFRIEVRDQSDGGHVLRLRGQCLSRQVYVEAAPPGLNPADRAAEATEDVLAPRKAPDGGGGAAGGREANSQSPPTGLQSAPPTPPPIVLRFPKADNNAAAGAGAAAAGDKASPGVMRLVVGCLATNDPKKSSAGSFEVELSSEAKETGYFAFTPEKGTVSPGATADVSCAFEPPPPPPRMPGPAGGKGSTLEVGQWYKTTALVHLRGGYRPPGSSETLTVSVQLEGFVAA